MSPDPSRVGRRVWHHVDRNDPHNSGWWQTADLIRWDDGRVTLETNTRGSVVSTIIVLDAESLARLREALT